MSTEDSSYSDSSSSESVELPHEKKKKKKKVKFYKVDPKQFQAAQPFLQDVTPDTLAERKDAIKSILKKQSLLPIPNASLDTILNRSMLGKGSIPPPKLRKQLKVVQKPALSKPAENKTYHRISSDTDSSDPEPRDDHYYQESDYSPCQSFHPSSDTSASLMSRGEFRV